MIYTFNDFAFNSDSLVLTQGGASLEIRPNEAKLLALLIERADTVIGKEQILAEVWQDKVVSEQAVFQNISNLRGLFGNDAIKTFPKRGYQWQLPVQEKSHVSTESKGQVNEQVTDSEVSSEAKVSRGAGVIALSLILISALIFVYTSYSNSEVQDIELAYIPIENANGEQVIDLADVDGFSTHAITGLNHWQFMAAIELEYSQLGPLHPFILTAKVRQFEQTYYLNFLVKGPADEWSGTLSAHSLKALKEKLKQHLSHSFIYQLLAQPHSHELKQATLSLAHQQLPNDFVLLDQLALMYQQMGEYEKAMVLAEKLEDQASQQGDEQQRALSLFRQAELLNLKQLHDLSDRKVTQAEQAFNSINDDSGLADVWDLRSKLAFELRDYPAVRESLVQSASYAEKAQNIEQELHALTYLSVLAHKFKQEQDKYLYLTKAEQKMKEYELPQYRFAKVPFHYAIYSPTMAAKEPHLKQVLVFTELTPDHWVAQVSRKQLVRYYLEQDRFNDAADIVAQAKSDNAENSYLKTLLAQAQQDTRAFIKHAKKTFEQAELTGDRQMSLNAALMLYEQQDTDEY